MANGSPRQVLQDCCKHAFSCKPTFDIKARFLAVLNRLPMGLPRAFSGTVERLLQVFLPRMPLDAGFCLCIKRISRRIQVLLTQAQTPWERAYASV
jgi:hypothetical protein